MEQAKFRTQTQLLFKHWLEFNGGCKIHFRLIIGVPQIYIFISSIYYFPA